MKHSYILLIIFVILGCNKKYPDNEKAIQILKNEMNIELTLVMDSIINEVDEILIDLYQAKTIDNAYGKFLEYLSTNSQCNYQLDLSPTELKRLLELFEHKGLREEFWHIEQTDTVNYISSAFEGLFSEATQNIDTLDCYLNGYYKSRFMIAGSPSLALIAKYIIENEFDTNNYLIKVVVGIDLFYYALQNTDYKINYEKS